MSSALSAASSACDHLYNWVHGTPADTWVSMAVFSDGSYNAPSVSPWPCARPVLSCVCTPLSLLVLWQAG